MNRAAYDIIRAEVAALSGDPLREYLADIMGRSTAAGAVPRSVIIGRLAAKSDDELRAHIFAALEHAQMIEQEAAARGREVVVIYDPDELARVQAQQRELKE